MAKTYAQAQAQIAKLQREAEALRRKEVEGVLDRIRDAIAFYQLTPEDIFGPAGNGKRREAEVASPDKPSERRKGAAAGRSKSRKGLKVPIKYRDASGNSWSGRGSKPRWLVAALSEGHKLDSFLVG